MSERDPLKLVGTSIAEKYLVEALVGEGGFALVYRARHQIWNQPVAIKFFSGLSAAPADQRDELRDAFIQEGALLTELSSQTASIVQARDIGTYTSPDGQWMPYMVLEWLDGEPLDTMLARELAEGRAPWTLADVAALLEQVKNGLSVAHQRGIAHRDIKPANLFVLTGPGGHEAVRVKVLDFGVAKMMSENTQVKAALAKTGTSVTSFTPQYGAPEQFNRAYGATGPWTDVYALALVATELLTGKLALDGDDLVQLAFSSANPERRPTPRALGTLIPDGVERVFQRALAVATTERYETVDAFWQDLHGALGSGPAATMMVAPTQMLSTASPLTGPDSRLAPTTANPTTTATASGPTMAKKGPVVIAGGVMLAVLVGGGIFFAQKGGSTDSSAPSAAAVLAPPGPTGAEIPTPKAPTCPQEMVKIPGGQFFMGSDAKDARDNEKPSHNVTLSAFCIDLYEVTAGDYMACSDVGKCKRARPVVDWPNISKRDKEVYGALCTIGDPEKKNHPINCLSWDLADAYCKANEKQLPTEAEWEYATRGPDGRVYPWGDEAPTAKHLNACGPECLAWAKKNGVANQFPGTLYDVDDGYETTAPVGKFVAGRSRFGPFDVVGNVWEWVSDWEGPYDALATTNPEGPKTGTKRVIRGGGWNGSFASWLRPSFRFAQDPAASSHGVGFRCASRLEPQG